MALRDDLRIIRDHFVRTVVFLSCETSIALIFRWNPAHLPEDIVRWIVFGAAWFVVATVAIFTVTCFLLLIRSSWRELFSSAEVGDKT